MYSILYIKKMSLCKGIHRCHQTASRVSGKNKKLILFRFLKSKNWLVYLVQLICPVFSLKILI